MCLPQGVECRTARACDLDLLTCHQPLRSWHYQMICELLHSIHSYTTICHLSAIIVMFPIQSAEKLVNSITVPAIPLNL
jgi:hypothetical protein